MDSVVGMIVAVCLGNSTMYMVQEYPSSCKMYYTNCIVTKIYEGASDEDALKVCKDESKTKIAK